MRVVAAAVLPAYFRCTYYLGIIINNINIILLYTQRPACISDYAFIEKKNLKLNSRPTCVYNYIVSHYTI